MKTLKEKAQVIMLPHKDGVILKSDNGIIHRNTFRINPNNLCKDETLNHLYIVSDEEIKEGDWILLIDTDNSYNIEKVIKEELQLVNESLLYKKIIATTDTSLSIQISIGTNEDQLEVPINYEEVKELFIEEDLPQPTQEWIEKYIKEYNKGNIITNVLVGYIEEFVGADSIREYTKLFPRLSKDNTITIYPVKDNLKTLMDKDPDIRQEVEQLLFQYASEEWGADSSVRDIEKFNNWIEQNL